MSSKTKIASLDKLARDPELGSVLLRLMNVLNDCSIAHESVNMWRARKDEKSQVRVEEASKYFIETQIAHLHEGLDIIREIDKKGRLRAFVDQSSPNIRNDFAELLTFKPSDRLGKMLARIRNNLAFHYDPKMFRDALTGYVKQFPGQEGMMSMGSDAEEWFFEPAAMISERVAVVGVFGMIQDATADAETTKLMAELQEIMHTFTRFAGYFIWKHVKS